VAAGGIFDAATGGTECIAPGIAFEMDTQQPWIHGQLPFPICLNPIYLNPYPDSDNCQELNKVLAPVKMVSWNLSAFSRTLPELIDEIRHFRTPCRWRLPVPCAINMPAAEVLQELAAEMFRQEPDFFRSLCDKSWFHAAIGQ
jgi:hypothetical protein